MTGVPPFHQRVYAERAIPPGRTLTYGEVAARLGEPGASRAVGQALGHNPFAPIVPCHRVLAAANGSGEVFGGRRRVYQTGCWKLKKPVWATGQLFDV